MKIIAIEGIDGSGKSTLLDKLFSEALKLDPEKICLFKTPYGCKSKEIEILLKKKGRELAFYERFSLYHSGNIIPILEAKLNNCQNVVLDRYFLSSFTYSIPANTKFNLVKDLLKIVKPFILKSEFLIYLKVDERIWKRRLRERKNAPNQELEKLTGLDKLIFFKNLMDFLVKNYWSFFSKTPPIILNNNQEDDLVNNLQVIRSLLE